MTEEHRAVLTNIGLNILYYRKQKGYTQQKLAELASYSKNYVQRVETGKAAPSIFVLLDISKVLGISIDKLFEKR